MFGLRGLRPDLEISGFETAFSEIAPRLVRRGHRVTMYCRAGAHSPTRRAPREDGVELVYIPSPGGKNFAAPTSTALAVLSALATRRFDVWFFVNVGMGHHCAVARLSGRPVVLNVDGLDWQRGKWGPVARGYFYSAAHAAVRCCTRLVTDAEAMRAFYRERFNRESTVIAYGADVENSSRAELIATYGVKPREYYLIVSRLIPENSLEIMLEGYRASPTEKRLLVVGGANYRDRFHRRLEEIADSDPRIHLVGHVHDQARLKELWCNCYAYLHGHSVGGTNPALLRAMGYGSCVLARDTVFNRETLADAGYLFAPNATAVAEMIRATDASPAYADALRGRAQRRIADHYGWERIVDQYETLFVSAAAGARGYAPDVRPDGSRG